MGNPKEFSIWLQGELKKRDWSISQLSRKSQISDAHLSRLLAGNRKPGVDALGAIAQALELPVALVYRQAGILPGDHEPNELEEEWRHVFHRAKNRQEQQELLEHARFVLKQIQARGKR